MRQNRWGKVVRTEERIPRNPMLKKQVAVLDQLDELFEELRDLRLQVGQWINDTAEGEDTQKEEE